MSGVEVGCFYCGEPVVPRRSSWRRIHAWERKAGRARKGGADVAAREYHDLWACDRCVDRIRHGVGVRQESLL